MLGEGEEGPEGSRKTPQKEMCFAESCEMSRNLSHGLHSQATERDVHEQGGVRKPGMLGTSDTSVSLPVMSQEGSS